MSERWDQCALRWICLYPADLWSTCWTNVTLFPSHMKNAKGGGGKFTLKWYWLSTVLEPDVIGGVSLCSSRNYMVPDPPGLFDGHVWPMYLKHKEIMEASGVDVCKSLLLSFMHFHMDVFSHWFEYVCYYSGTRWNQVKGTAVQLCLWWHPEQHPEVSLRKVYQSPECPVFPSKCQCLISFSIAGHSIG